MTPELRFKTENIRSIASRYAYGESDNGLQGLKGKVKKQGCLSQSDLQKVAKWKAPRSAGHVNTNQEEFVREITRFALNTENERARIEGLTVLDGVGWPTATVILHFFHKDQYPILDYRAPWSVSLELPKQYSFGFWWTYVEYCRETASEAGVDMRTLDMALWQYSKENQ